MPMGKGAEPSSPLDGPPPPAYAGDGGRGEGVMRKRWRWVLAGMVIAFLLVAGSRFLAASQSDRIIGQNFDRIKDGMTLAEVEQLLGPPGDRTTRAEYLDGPHISVAFREDNGPFSKFEWMSDRGYISVTFDASGRAYKKSYMRNDSLEQNLADEFFWQVNRQWRRWFPDR